MTAILISNRELDQIDIQLDRQALNRLTAALRKKDKMGWPPPRVEFDDYGALLIVAADLTGPEIERAKEWFVMEAIKAAG